MDSRNRYICISKTAPRGRIRTAISVLLCWTLCTRSSTKHHHAHPSASFFLYYDGLKSTSEPQLASSYAIAERLSFFLRNAPPDEELRLAAQQDTLQDRNVIYQQARRLSQSTQAFDTLESFHYDWLNLYLLDSLFKDPNAYPDFGTHTVEAMKKESAVCYGNTVDG